MYLLDFLSTLKTNNKALNVLGSVYRERESFKQLFVTKY